MNYQLKNPPKRPVQAAIRDDDGKVVRELRVPAAHPGLNRVTWDLHYDPPQLIALRTTPPENPHIWEEPRFRGAGFASDHALGRGAGARWGRWSRRGNTRCG